MYTAVTGRNGIPEAEFPEHVKQMHQDKDQKLELEYKVSSLHTVSDLSLCGVWWV